MQFLKITKKESFIIVEMQRAKVNAINLQMVNELRAVFKETEADEGIQGMILMGLPSVFSAGLDLVELYSYDKEKMREFFIAFGSMHVEMVKFPKPLICGITGHSPAGGTVIAITADHRIMAEGEKYGIGLNELAVNVQISTNLINGYAFWLGQSQAYKNVMAGRLLSPKEALAQGLVDEVVPMDEILERAEERMEQYLEANNGILLNTKAKLRKPWIDSFVNEAIGLEELAQAEAVWWSPEVRQRMQMFIHFLKNRKK